MKVPRGWRSSSVGDETEFVGGSQPPKSTFVHTPRDGYVRLIQIRDYKTNDFATFIPQKLARRWCSKEDVMIGRYGPPIFQILKGIEGAYNVALIKATPKPTVLRSYLYYFLQLTPLFHLIDSLSRRTSGQTGIDMDALKSFPFPVPPIEEQEKIVRAIEKWDTAIENLRSLIDAKVERKRGLMQQLLSGRKRLSGFDGKWTERLLGELVKAESRPKPKPKNNFLSAGIRSHCRGVFLKPDFAPEDIALTDLFEMRTGDLVVNITFAWEGAAAIVPPEAHGALVSHRFPTYIFRQDVACPAFFRHLIQTKRFKFDCGLASPGGAGRNRVLSKRDFLKIKVSCPDLIEQAAIGEVLDTCDRELNLHRQQLDAIREQKRGLMQKLLTGEVMVK